MNISNTLLDTYDAAALLLLSTQKVRALVRTGHLPHIALPNGEIRFTEADLLAWIESHKRKVGEAAPCR